MHKHVTIILASALALIPVRLWAADYTWTGNAGNGNWEDSDNWDGGTGVPGSADSATIGGNATVTVPAGSEDFSIGGLKLSGTLNIEKTGTITISGDIEVSGTIRSTGPITFQSAITLTGDTTFELGDTVAFNDGITAAGFNLMISTTGNNSWTCPTVSIGSGNLIISSESSVTLGSSSHISVEGLLLRGSGDDYNFEYGSSALEDNTISKLASDTTGDITVRTSIAITIGSISPIGTGETVSGLRSGNATIVSSANINQTSPIVSGESTTLRAGGGSSDITLTSTSNSFGTLTLNGNAVQITQNENELTLGNIRANSLLLAASGEVTQLASTLITHAGGGSCSLQVEGTGPFSFSRHSNEVSTLAVRTTDDFTYNGIVSLTIGNLNLGDEPVTGIDTGGTLTVYNDDTITINETIRTHRVVGFSSFVSVYIAEAEFIAETGLLNLGALKLGGNARIAINDENKSIHLGAIDNVPGPEKYSLTLEAGNIVINDIGSDDTNTPAEDGFPIGDLILKLYNADDSTTVSNNILLDGTLTSNNGTVIFSGGDSILEAEESTFKNLRVHNSELEVRNGDFTASGELAVLSDTNPAQLIFGRGNHRAAIAKLRLQGANSSVVDFADWNFSIGASLDNEYGKIKLSGEQSTQTFAYDDANKNKMGLVSYYGGDEAGTIRHEDFWNLEIDADGQTISLGSDINIHGFHDPKSDKTLDTPVSEAALIGLHLRGGTLNTANHTITLHGSYIRADTATISNELRLTLLGDYPSYIGGDNEFFEFICEDASVQGKIIYFQRDKTIGVEPSGRFVIRGGNTHPPGNRLDPNSLVFPSPRSYVYVVSSHPVDANHYWNFHRVSSAQSELEFVYILHSDATTNPQVKPVNVTFQDCPGWHSPSYIMLSWTKDIGDLEAAAVHNGRIDKILVDSKLDLNMNFSALEVEVEGYRVKGFQSHGVNANQFYIKLEEQPYLDTAATPRWKIVRNDSLKDLVNGFEVKLYDGGEDSTKAKPYEIPYDDAAPIIGYTLAIADKKKIFVHFSEPVVRPGSSSITKDDFSTAAGGGVIRSLSSISDETNNGIRELILTTGNSISAEDILNGVTVSANSSLEDIPSPESTHDFDVQESDAVDVIDVIVNSTHRISDVGLGVVGNGLVEPISARSNIIPVSGSGPGIVSKFAWSDFLPADDFSIIAHRYTGISENPILVYSNSAPSELRNGKLWLPNFGENAELPRNFSGLVPGPHNQTLTKNASSSKNDNYTYQFTVPDSMIGSGRDLEFVFYFENSELYCAQVLDDTASNWYRQVLPWAIKIQDIAAQAGGVSILNNILNPNSNDRTSIYYELRKGGVVTIQVFDLSGDTVAVLQRGFQSAGKYTVSWDGRNGAGNPVARGIYFVRFVGPDKMDQIRKVLVIK